MTNGGYTLIWSYSEKTAYEKYAPVNQMSMDGSIRLNLDYPRNRVTTDTTINYNDWRLSYNDIQGVMGSTTAPIRVRITSNPTNTTDEWAANNYAVITPLNISGALYNPLTTTSNSSYYYTFNYYNVSGKIFGLPWIGNSTTHTLGGVVYNDGAMYQNDGLYATHFNFATTFANNNYQFTVSPPMNIGTTTLTLGALNNIFGLYANGEYQPNHHFGKCGGQSGSDYDFTPQTCTSLYPHSFNDGQGRYCQWFVK